MLKLNGVAASPGVALGAAHLFGWRIDICERKVEQDEVASELAQFESALRRSEAQLERIQQQIAQEEGEKHQSYQILEAHRLMLRDPHLVQEARHSIQANQCAAEWAVQQALDQISAVFDKIEDPYFRERRGDINAVGERLLRNLVERADPGRPDIPHGSIVYGHDISPADVGLLARAGVKAFFTEAGGKTSHTAVLARALGLPLVVGVHDALSNLRSGKRVIVDGTRGDVILEPDSCALGHYEVRSARDRARNELLSENSRAASDTLDGHHIHLAANVELLEEVPVAVDQGAASVGLFRTEFLYLEGQSLPTEDEQYEHIVSALQPLGGRLLTLRTLDLGGDKMPGALKIPAGANPALGMRSIRYSLWQRDVFKTQLRAIYRAAARGPVRILFPLISGLGEFRTVKAICEEVCEDLDAQGIEIGRNVALGAMVETPSAALVADSLAEECDFLTIGTNDLIQYALAADRQDEHVGYLYHPLHPAIIRAVKLIVEGARQAGKPIAMCGDMAGDPMFLWILLGLGLRDLSMAPRQIPVQKAVIRGTRVADAKALLQHVMALKTVEEVEGVVGEVMEEHFPDLMDLETESIAP